MVMQKNHVRYATFVLWILLSLLEQISQNPLWGALSECAAYILSF